MKNDKQNNAGFTLVELMIVVAILGLLAAIAIPNYIRVRTVSQTNACIYNLRELDNAKQQWALEYGHSGADIPNPDEVKPYIGRGGGSLNTMHCPLKLPAAPLAGYVINAVSVPPTCQQLDPVHHPAEIN